MAIDVLFDYKYVVQGDIIALLISIVTACLLRSTYMAKKANLGIFKFANKLISLHLRGIDFSFNLC